MFQRITIFLALCTILLSSCIAPIQPSSALIDTSTSAPVSMNACYINGSSAHVAVQYAFEKGLFQKHGLQVNLLGTESGSKAGTALITGSFDLCSMSGSAIISAVAAGADPVIIGGLSNTSIYALMVTAEIQTPADLAGKVVATNQPGGGVDLVTRRVLQHLGLQPDQDVTLLAVGGQGERMAAMAAGQAAGTLMTVPESVKAVEKGFHQLFDVATLQLPTPYVTIATTRTYLATNRPQVVQFMAAISEAVALMKKDRPGTIETLAKYLQFDPIADAASLEEAYTVLVQKYMERIPYPTLEGIQAEIEILALENPQVATLKPEDVVDMSVVRELEENGWFKTLYE